VSEGVKEAGQWPFEELPSSWAWAPFEEVFKNVTESKLKLPANDYLSSGEFPVVDQGQDYVAGYTDREELVNPAAPPTIVFGDHTRTVKFVPFQFVQGADGVKVLSTSHAVESKFGGWALKALRLPDKGYSRHFRFLRASQFPLAPLPEQRRIVAKIEELFSELDAGAAALERAQAKLERYRASVLKAAVEGKLTVEWRAQNPPEETGEELLKRILVERRKRWEEEQLKTFEEKGRKPPKNWKEKYKEPVGPDTSELPELPEGWCWGTVDQLAWNIGYGTSRKCGYDGVGEPVLRIPNIRSGRIDTTDLKFAMSSETTGLGLEPGDMLVVRTNGSLDLIGRAGLVVELPETTLSFASYLIRLRLASDHRVARWVSLVWDSIPIRSILTRRAASSAGQYNLSIAKLSDLPIPLPPESELPAVLALLGVTEAYCAPLTRTQGDALVRASALRQSILKRAFEGRLVPQDPSDEPASVLLERIRAERDVEKPEKKRRTKKKANQESLDI
jgi:type I restriction enzyme, S subunit